MNVPADRTLLVEAMMMYAGTLENELRRSHSILFAATFLDEFKPEIRKLASYSLARHRPGWLPPA